MVERSLSMREVPGSIPGISRLLSHHADMKTGTSFILTAVRVIFFSVLPPNLVSIKSYGVFI